jgi:hypothetical protein
MQLGIGIASMGIYLLMALVLLIRPKGLFRGGGLSMGCPKQKPWPCRVGLPLIRCWPMRASPLPCSALATRILIYAIAAASLNFMLGYGGMVSFGHAAFFGVGGYVVGILFSTMPRAAAVGFIPGRTSC